MNTPAMLFDLIRAGAKLFIIGERVTFDAPAGVMTPERRAALATRKAELHAILGGRWMLAASALLTRIMDTMTPDEWFALDEPFLDRVRQCENGGMSLIDAQAVAYQELAERLEPDARGVGGCKSLPAPDGPPAALSYRFCHGIDGRGVESVPASATQGHDGHRG